jgi:hypothetical protein
MWSPSAKYLADIYIAMRGTKMPSASHARQDYQTNRMSMLTGKFLRNDDNFKLPKYVRRADGSKAFNAMNTTMNEYGEVVSRVLLTGNSHEPLVEPLQRLTQRYKDRDQVRCVVVQT